MHWERIRPTEAEETDVDDFMTCRREIQYSWVVPNKTIKGYACQKTVSVVRKQKRKVSKNH